MADRPPRLAKASGGDGASGATTATAHARAMGRLRAERVVAAAQRLAPLEPARRKLSVSAVPHRLSDGASAITAKPRGSLLLQGGGAGGASASSTLVPAAQDVYLQQTGVHFLLEDLVKRLQEDRPPTDQLSGYLATFFTSVVRGSHVKGREYEYVNGTLQNRIAFLTQLQRGLAGVDPALEITSDDFAELVWNHCGDVPTVLLDQACSHMTESPDGPTTAAPLHSFVSSFGACFVYNEFLTKVHNVYSELVQASQTSSPRGSNRSESIASAMAADRVVARLRLLAHQSAMTIPPLGEVESFVFKSSSFRESAAIAATLRELQTAFATLSGSDAQS